MCSSDSNRYSKFIAACTLTLVTLGFEEVNSNSPCFKKTGERERLGNQMGRF